VFSEVIVYPDEVKGRGNEDEGVGALHGRFEDGWKELVP
jgi:hypothetical protein